MKKFYLKETTSTNTFLLDYIANNPTIDEATVVYTYRQSAGRGQIGNIWEAEFDKNVLFSIFLRPTFLPIKQQFLLSEISCLAIVKGLSMSVGNEDAMRFEIKWPNDIYINDEKICGMLIENSLMGSELQYSIIGIGINVNQTKWVGNAPNPTSLKLCVGKEFVAEEVLDNVLSCFESYYSLLKEGCQTEIHREYLSMLYRRDGWHRYKDVATGKMIDARIIDVEPMGALLMEDSEGKERRYMFKEVEFFLKK